MRVKPTLIKGSFDRNQKFYPDHREKPIDFAAMKGTQTKYYAVRQDSVLGKRISDMVREAVRERAFLEDLET